MHIARNWIAEIAENTLATISSHVHGVTIDRGNRVAVALSALEKGRYLEIRGAGGVGKSGVIKDLAQRIGIESRIVVIAPHRIPGGGWAALAAQLDCEVTAREFLTDLAGDGGGTLFVDGIDRFDDPGQRATVVDLIRAASQVRGFSVVVTARLDFDADARAWLPAQALQDLGEAPPLVIDELGDDVVAQLEERTPRSPRCCGPGILPRSWYETCTACIGWRAAWRPSTPRRSAKRTWHGSGGRRVTWQCDRLPGRRRKLRSLATSFAALVCSNGEHRA